MFPPDLESIGLRLLLAGGAAIISIMAVKLGDFLVGVQLHKIFFPEW